MGAREPRVQNGEASRTNIANLKRLQRACKGLKIAHRHRACCRGAIVFSWGNVHLRRLFVTPTQSSQGKFPCACSLPSRAPPCCLVRACGVRCRGVLSRSSPQSVITCSHHWVPFLYSALERWSQLAGLMAKRDDRTRCSFFFTTNGSESDSKSDYLPACCENPAARSESLDRKDGLTGNQT